MPDNKLLSKVIDYKELIAYQEGAVVSRTIIDKDIGTVTVFAFDAGQKLSTHSAPFDAMVQVLDGQAKIKINEEEFILDAPKAIIMPANQPHSVYAAAKFKMLLTMIKSK